MSLLGQAATYWRLAWGLRKFLKEPLTLEQSRQFIRQGLQDREKNLLTMVKGAIYGNKTSPYSRLLAVAGCEYPDFEKMVLSDGIEPSLHKLREQGVYLSYEEFKGKKEVVRGGKTFNFEEMDFDNPSLISHLEARGSASRSTGTRVVMDLDRCRNEAAHNAVAVAAHGAWGKPVLLWMPILPSALGLIWLLGLAKVGNPPLKWFSPVEAEPAVHQPSMLGHWPVQLTLVPVRAPFLQGADVVLAADCVPFAYAGFHREFLKDYALLVACPKLDNFAAHQQKLTDILVSSDIKSLTVVHMEVPCCSGLVQLARQAIAASGKDIPLREVTIGIKGAIKNTV